MSTLQPYQQRVVVECNDLDAKIDALAKFIASPAFADVDSDERERLRQQLGCMGHYRDVLNSRIAAFKRAAP